MQIQFITEKQMIAIIEDRKNPDNFGAFITDYAHDGCTACDNRDGDAWTEDFTTVDAAIEWLTETDPDPKPLRVCPRCLLAIESREGAQTTTPIYIDESDLSTTCEWCGADYDDTLYQIN